MDKHVYFVRHGESEGNASGVHRGPDTPINEKGLAQAKLVAERVARIGVDALVSSPWPRARATADAIAVATGLAVEENDLFTERRRPSAYIGKAHREPAAVAMMKEIFDGYLVLGHRHSDEENLDDLRKRTNAALDPAFDGRLFRGALRALETDNTGIFHFKYEETRGTFDGFAHWRIIQWNDSAHLG